MPLNNLIDKRLSQSKRDQLNDLLTQMYDILEGELVYLNEEERQRYGSINEDNKLIVNKVADYYTTSPNLSSPQVDWVEYMAEMEERKFLGKFLFRIKGLVYDIESTKMLHDYDCFQDALTDYDYIKYLAKRGITAAIAKFQDLSQFFAKLGRRNGSSSSSNSE